MPLDIPTTKKCGHLKVPFVCLAKQYVTQVCMLCVITCPCNIILSQESQSIDRFHNSSSTNSTQGHIQSPFLMVCVVTAIILLFFNILPIINIWLHSRDSCECNCLKIMNPIFYIFLPYKSLWLFFLGFSQIPKSNFIA